MELGMRRLVALIVGLLLAVAPCALAPAQTDAPAQTPQAGDEWIEPITGMEFVWVPGGCYEMGCGEWAGYDCDEDEFPVHEVCVDGFWMGKYEVTKGQWKRIMRHSSGNAAEFDIPLTHVSWQEASDFTKRLSHLYFNIFHFRLSTEAEWEYSCRSGGLAEMYSGSNDADAVAWCSNNSDNTIHPIGTKSPNGLGIFDMSGNVWEWVQDWYSTDTYIENSNNIPEYSDTEIYKVIRGGSFSHKPTSARCSSRSGNIPDDNMHSAIGFRIAFN